MDNNDQLMFFDWLDEEVKPSRFKTCQCGAETTYGRELCNKQPFLHSYWCPDFKDTRTQENKVDTDVRSW